MTPYMSAINKFLYDHALPPVGLGPLVAIVRKGLKNSQQDTDPLPQRLPPPAPVAHNILERGEKLLLRTDWTPRDPHLHIVRATFVTVAAYDFFNRGEWSACALAGDLVVSNTHITLLLRHEKRKKGLMAGYKSVRQIASHEVPRIVALLGAFFKGQQLMAELRGNLTRRWSISLRKDKETWSALTLSKWLRIAYTSRASLPSKGFSLNSHNLRKGVASAAHAIVACLADIRFAGGWATTSNVLEAKYIDFTIQPSADARLFFDCLCKGASH